jgi:hypothetical protein
VAARDLAAWPVAAIVLFSLSGALSAAPALKNGKDDLYHPTAAGAKRVYESRSGDNSYEYTEVVTAAEKKGDAYRVSVGRESAGEVSALATVEVSARGVFRLGTAGTELPKPLPLLKLPAKPGDTWESDPAAAKAGVGPTVYTVGKEEEVEVPAGKFRAIPVEAVRELKGRTFKSTSWYAPGVGLVKLVSSSGASERVQVLKSFTPGK